MNELASPSVLGEPVRAVEPPAPHAERDRLRRVSLSRWENEGGAGLEGPLSGSASANSPFDDPASIRTEAVQLRVRVIALENLVIALLARVPESQLALAREMADYISPRPGCTPHHLTLRAADEMRSLVDRANPFRAAPAGPQQPSARSGR